MISGLYFHNTPAHMRPARAKCEATRNRAISAGMRSHSGRYAEAKQAEARFKVKVLPRIEQARKRGDIVSFNGKH